MRKLSILMILGLILALFPSAIDAESPLVPRMNPTCLLLYKVFQEDFKHQNSGRGSIADVNDDGIVALNDLVLIQQNRFKPKWCKAQFWSEMEVQPPILCPDTNVTDGGIGASIGVTYYDINGNPINQNSNQNLPNDNSGSISVTYYDINGNPI